MRCQKSECTQFNYTHVKQSCRSCREKSLSIHVMIHIHIVTSYFFRVTVNVTSYKSNLGTSNGN